MTNVTEAEAIANVQQLFPNAAVINVEPTREMRNARYLNGVCIDCGEKPHSAGRPRCDECHRILVAAMAGYDQ